MPKTPDGPASGDPSKKFDRRQVLKTGGLGGFALLGGGAAFLSACGSDSGGGSTAAKAGTSTAAKAKPVTLTFADFGGGTEEAYRKAWSEPYMKANPHVKIVHDNPTDTSKIIAMAKSGNVTWSLADATNEFGLKQHAAYLEEMDCTVIPCDDLIGELTPWRVPLILASMNIGYRTDKHSKGPQTWADIFDVEKFPGKRAFWDVVPVSGFLEFALIADGVEPTKEALYPLDVDRAYKKMDTIKDHIVWYSDLAQGNKLLADGEIDYMVGFNGRLSDLKQQGVPVKIEWAKGTMGAIDYFVVPKGAPDVPEIMKFIAYCLAPENCGRVSDYVAYGPPNKKSKGNAKIADDLPSTHSDALFFQDDNWWAANAEKQTERYKNWV